VKPKTPKTQMSDTDAEPLSPAQEAAVAKVRRLMVISSATLVIGMGAVFGVIGYKVFTSGDSPSTAADGDEPRTMVEAIDKLPPGARVVGTAIGEAQIVVTIEVGGATELRTYDPDTLRPLGRLRLAPQQ
jgi:hypothetical protein